MGYRICFIVVGYWRRVGYYTISKKKVVKILIDFESYGLG